MEIYLVISACGEYEDYRENIEKAFLKEEDAMNYKKELDEAYMIKGPVFNIVPEDVYCEWPVTDEDDTPLDSYKGYTTEQYLAQQDRLEISYLRYSGSRVQEITVE